MLKVESEVTCLARKHTPPPTERLIGLSTTQAIGTQTAWAVAVGLDVIKAAARLKAHVAGGGNLNVQLVYQTASVRVDEPDDWQVLLYQGNPVLTVTGNGGVCSGIQNIASITAGKMFIRFGLAYCTTATGAPPSGDVSLVVSTLSFGDLIGGFTGQLTTTSSTGTPLILTAMVPALMAEKVKASFLLTSISGSFQCQLAYRVADTSKDAPGAWNTIGSAVTATGVLGDTTITVGASMWVQFALIYSLSGGSLATASVSVAVGARKA